VLWNRSLCPLPLFVCLPVFQQMIALGTDFDVGFDPPGLLFVEFTPNKLIGNLNHFCVA
jgi:hypothetical protein